MIIDRFCRRKFEIDLKALKDYAWRMKTKIIERYATQLPPNGESMQNLFVKEEDFFFSSINICSTVREFPLRRILTI